MPPMRMSGGRGVISILRFGNIVRSVHRGLHRPRSPGSTLACATSGFADSLSLSHFCSRETAYESACPEGARAGSRGCEPPDRPTRSERPSPGGATARSESRTALWKFPTLIRPARIDRTGIVARCRPSGAGGEMNSSPVRGLSPPATCLGPFGAARAYRSIALTIAVLVLIADPDPEQNLDQKYVADSVSFAQARSTLWRVELVRPLAA
jgi:hypothetical protein